MKENGWKISGAKPTWRFLSTLPALLVLLYFGKVSVLSLSGFLPVTLLAMGDKAMLMLSLGLLCFSGSVRQVSFAALVLLVLTFGSSLLAISFKESVLRWVAWSLLFTVVGPMFWGTTVGWFRNTSWNTLRILLVGISLSSMCWYVLGLPVLGRGIFTGVMLHSMLLSPIAGLSALCCLIAAIFRGSITYTILAGLSLLVCLLASSRSAVVALMGALLLLVLLVHYHLSFRRMLAIVIALIIFLFVPSIYRDYTGESNNWRQYTVELEKKGLENTRERLWHYRIREFKENKIFGVGIGMGYVRTGSGVKADKTGRLVVEPGSSYLAVLSMTGLLGAISLLVVCGRLLQRVTIQGPISRYSLELIETLCVLSFLAIHMAAEGYIYAVGNPFCLVLWLSLGRLQDLTDPQMKAGVASKERTFSHENMYFDSSHRALPSRAAESTEQGA